MGVWSAIAAADRTGPVCLVEKYTEGHARGSSHGDGRIYRFAYADEIYVDMMYLSLSYWGELNNATSKVLAHTGGVSLYSGQGGNYDSHGGLDDLIKIYKKKGPWRREIIQRSSRSAFSSRRRRTRRRCTRRTLGSCSPTSRSVWKSTSVPGAGSVEGDEPASPRHRASVASMAWRTTRRTWEI